MAAMTPSTAFLPRTIHLGLSSIDRKAIEQQIEALIDLLDQIDGDADLEPDHDAYDPCDHGEPVEHMGTLPQYGGDQSKGPLNFQAAYRVYAEGAIR
ncbi:hypothetical protein N6H05_01670 [Sphingobium sp. WTD-1]|uniref:hypothetical protein n=1 Tax=Sphingobium sp. WTD-1 TaxID=2979467 RepID=UPI0024DE84C2|nr:hypothetical protein [Sphingobium sp. WTD-1]WIA56562.1 hypothetical protein N6H05_01670 [Sphingobium sp. WTD-1]